jgi:hypothetical protein
VRSGLPDDRRIRTRWRSRAQEPFLTADIRQPNLVGKAPPYPGDSIKTTQRQIYDRFGRFSASARASCTPKRSPRTASRRGHLEGVDELAGGRSSIWTAVQTTFASHLPGQTVPSRRSRSYPRSGRRSQLEVARRPL